MLILKILKKWTTLKIVSLIIMAVFYMFAGISHFRKPAFFLSITPKWVPFPKKPEFDLKLTKDQLFTI